MDSKKKILTINLGSTSTKLALFEDDTEILKQELSLKAEDLQNCKLMIDQLPMRMESVQKFVAENGIVIKDIDMIVTRGGSIHGVHSGAYIVDEHVVAVHLYSPRSQMPSSLAAVIGYKLGHPAGVPVIFYDAPSADDADEIMHYTGLPEAKRFVTSHCLNSKVVAHEVADKLGKPYSECSFVVAHLGGGITIALHSGGRMVDTVLDDAGPMSPQRAGRIPVTDVINLCYCGQYTKQDMQFKMRGGGGLVAYFGVQDAREIENMISEGREDVKSLYWYMAYQVAKGIGELVTAAKGNVDVIILTGGMARSKMFTEWVKEYVSFLAPIEIIPGEHEMLGLARGGMRVLNCEEKAQLYRWLPEGISTLEDFLENYNAIKN